jgi:hypothetical protein
MGAYDVRRKTGFLLHFPPEPPLQVENAVYAVRRVQRAADKTMPA